jgi:c(7)-type cytochrome triheme protein
MIPDLLATRGLVLLLCSVLLLSPRQSQGRFNLPPAAPPEVYGNILIDRTSTNNSIKPVVFSHWRHRIKYSCRICHTELEFNLKVNTTEITEADNGKGKYCGACHNGKLAFGPKGNCAKCHTGNIRSGSEKFASSLNVALLPQTLHGNHIDWSKAYRDRTLVPRRVFRSKPQFMGYDKTLLLEAEWGQIAPAIFPHDSHKIWFDCNSCHPEPFNIKKKTTKHFSMVYLLKGEFCGVCHLNVAFPMNDCKRCHPAMNM